MNQRFWAQPLTKETAKLYAALNYQGTKTWSSFFGDLKGFSTLSRYLVRWENTANVDIRVALNQLIILGNMWPKEALARLCFILCKPETFPALKSLLRAIYRLPREIPELDLQEIQSSDRANQELQKVLK